MRNKKFTTIDYLRYHSLRIVGVPAIAAFCDSIVYCDGTRLGQYNELMSRSLIRVNQDNQDTVMKYPLAVARRSKGQLTIGVKW